MYNKVIMVGNLTRDIELRYLPSGSAIAKSAIATSYKYKSTTGEQKDEVCFLDFNIFGRSAEVANQYLKKGSKVLLEGRLVFEQWTAQDGSTRSRHSLRVDAMKMLDSKDVGAGSQQSYTGNEEDDQYSHIEQQYNRQAPSQYNHGGNQQQNNQSTNNSLRPRVEQRIPEIDIDEDEIPF